MRFPLRLQLLVPMLAVVVATIVGCSALSAYLAAQAARQRQEDNLQRVVATLTEASFPLSEAVLRRMSGLSGAEFVMFDAAGQPQGRSRTFSEESLQAARSAPVDQRLAAFSAGRVITLDGGAYLLSKLRLADRSDPSATNTLAVLYPLQRWSLAERQAVFPPLAVGAVAIVLVAALTTLLARRVTRPIEALRRQAVEIEQGNFRPMPLVARNDEIQDLTRAINHMVERLALYEADVRQNERLRTLGQLGAGIAHQLRNAATGARLALDLHRQSCPQEPGCETLDVATRQLALMENYLRRFLTLGRQDSVELAPVELGSLVAEVLPLVRSACDHARLELRQKPAAEPVWIQGSAESLAQMLVNLLLNAIEAAAATPAQPEARIIGAVGVEIAVDAARRPAFRVTDTGAGPSDKIRDRLFQAFASDKPDGAGLGLAVVQQIATQHSADLNWRREENLTVFEVRFPAPQIATTNGAVNAHMNSVREH